MDYLDTLTLRNYLDVGGVLTIDAAIERKLKRIAESKAQPARHAANAAHIDSVLSGAPCTYCGDNHHHSVHRPLHEEPRG